MKKKERDCVYVMWTISRVHVFIYEGVKEEVKVPIYAA